jgi:DNA polymerase III epsilon subunit-like protein
LHRKGSARLVEALSGLRRFRYRALPRLVLDAMTPLLFLDTETTGLGRDDEVWEIAAVLRDDNGERTFHAFIDHDEGKAAALPEPFRANYLARYNERVAITPRDAVAVLSEMCAGRPQVVGAVPSFDTVRLERMALRFGVKLGWHYHLIDVENVVLGYLLAERPKALTIDRLSMINDALTRPWKSDKLSRALGVNPDDYPRHTAMGDVRWVMAQWDMVNG